MSCGISNIPTASISRASLVRTEATTADGRSAAARLASVATDAVVEDPSLSSDKSVDLTSYTKATAAQYDPQQIVQQTAAAESMDAIRTELGKIDALIAEQRPELAGIWDFKLAKGELKVTGLSEDGAQWVEGRLNSNSALVGAAKAFTATAVANLQTTEENPSRAAFNYVTGHKENYTFFDVESQLSEKLSFRSMVQQADELLGSGQIVNLGGNAYGISGLAVAASVLTASNKPIEGASGAFYTVRYDPLGG
jgi:hypothetical protein